MSIPNDSVFDPAVPSAPVLTILVDLHDAIYAVVPRLGELVVEINRSQPGTVELLICDSGQLNKTELAVYARTPFVQRLTIEDTSLSDEGRYLAAIPYARGDYVLPLCATDHIRSGGIQAIVKLLRSNAASVYLLNYRLVHADGTVFDAHTLRSQHSFYRYSFQDLLRFIGTVSITDGYHGMIPLVFRRDKVAAVNWRKHAETCAIGAHVATLAEAFHRDTAVLLVEPWLERQPHFLFGRPELDWRRSETRKKGTFLWYFSTLALVELVQYLQRCGLVDDLFFTSALLYSDKTYGFIADIVLTKVCEQLLDYLSNSNPVELISLEQFEIIATSYEGSSTRHIEILAHLRRIVESLASLHSAKEDQGLRIVATADFGRFYQLIGPEERKKVDEIVINWARDLLNHMLPRCRRPSRPAHNMKQSGNYTIFKTETGYVAASDAVKFLEPVVLNDRPVPNEVLMHCDYDLLLVQIAAIQGKPGLPSDTMCLELSV